MATFSTVHLDLEEAYRREHYEGFESLLGPLVEQNDFLRVAAVLPSNNGATHKTLVAKSRQGCLQRTLPGNPEHGFQDFSRI